VVKLTAKQQRFVEEYLIDLNATQAAIRAGYSAKNAGKIGPELLGKTRVQEAIKAAMDKRSERTEITQNMVLGQLAKIAFSDITDFVKFGQKEVQVMGPFGPLYETVTTADPSTGKKKKEKVPITKIINFVDFNESGQVDGTIIAEVKQGKDGSSVKLNDRMKALELIGRHLGMFNDKLEVTGTTNNPFAGLTTEELKKLIRDG
jgi:phage terminase small subunit